MEQNSCKDDESLPEGLQEEMVEVALEEPLVDIVEVLHREQSSGLGETPAEGLGETRVDGLGETRVDGLGEMLVDGMGETPAEGLFDSVAAGQGGDASKLQAGMPGGGASPNIPFAEVASLLDPNMKSSKALKYQIRYDEVKRRLESPEKMSLRSLAAYTRVSRGPASRKTLLESLNVLGLAPSTTTAVSSSFSKLTEGDTAALCKDMRDFATQYMDYNNVAKQLLPETNHVQHWSKIIETRNHLEEMRKCFHDPANSRTFDNATHGFGPGMIDVAFEMIGRVIEKQIRILSGDVEPKEAQQGNGARRRRARAKTEAMGKARPSKACKDELGAQTKPKSRPANRKRHKEAEPLSEAPSQIESSVLTLVSVGYETVSSGMESTNAGVA